MKYSESLFRTIVESSVQGIVVVDGAGRIVMANPALEGLLGYTPGELSGRLLEELVPHRLRSVHVGHRGSYFQHPRERAMGLSQHLAAVRQNGTIFPVEVSLSYSGEGDNMLAIGFVADITERRRLERANERNGDRLHALTAQLLTAQEDERRRIARELHDGLTQDLASLGIEIELLRRAGEASADQLAVLQRSIAKLSDQTRQLAHEFHPGALEHSGLAAALEAYCSDLEQQTEIRIHFNTRDLPEHISREASTTLYRVAQEALRNVIKHSGASRADVLLTCETKENGSRTLRLSVMDDGHGFLIEDVRDGSGLGLLSIEERARLLGGTLTIGSVEGEGTRITIEVPLRQEI